MAAAAVSKQATPPPLTSSPYPFAAGPDIIRAHQKDAYFQGVLTNQVTDLHRRLRGARSAHAWATESRTAADLLYLCLTTLLGNRTLGEEYCDLVQVESPTSDSDGGPRLPSLARRAGYIGTSILLPYLFGRALPGIRASLRARLQDRLAALARRGPAASKSTGYKAGRYILTHLSSLTSGEHAQAVTLAIFYFGGAYYSLPKRLWALRYVFTRRPAEGPDGSVDGRAGYEVLGVLLVVQMVVRAALHVREQMKGGAGSEEEILVDAAIRERAFGSQVMGADVSLDENVYSSNNALLVGGGAGDGQRSLVEIGVTTHTPVPKGGRPRYDLEAGGEGVMGWIQGRQQRKCTLCLEGMKDPAATQCGHVFCWTCIGDWVREKPECPLCRRQTLVQHILPLRAP